MGCTPLGGSNLGCFHPSFPPLLSLVLPIPPPRELGMAGNVGEPKLAMVESNGWSVVNDTVKPPTDAHQIGRERKKAEPTMQQVYGQELFHAPISSFQTSPGRSNIMYVYQQYALTSSMK
ncbi:hypothetical protein AOLI_G00322670 [Acnodon oligacanthus]